MKVYNLKDMFKGWFIGNFDPSVLKTNDVEVGVQQYEEGEEEDGHVHKIASEITLVLEGRLLLNGKEYKEGDILIIEPNEPMTSFKTLTKVRTVVVKFPGANEDKYPLE